MYGPSSPALRSPRKLAEIAKACRSFVDQMKFPSLGDSLVRGELPNWEVASSRISACPPTVSAPVPHSKWSESSGR